MAHVGELVRSGLTWPVHLGELVKTHIIQSFICRGVHYFTEPSEGTVWFWYGLEADQFLSYDRPLSLGIRLIKLKEKLGNIKLLPEACIFIEVFLKFKATTEKTMVRSFIINCSFMVARRM